MTADRDALLHDIQEYRRERNPGRVLALWSAITSVLAAEPPALDGLSKALDGHAASHARDLSHHLCGADCAGDIAARLAAEPRWIVWSLNRRTGREDRLR